MGSSSTAPSPVRSMTEIHKLLTPGYPTFFTHQNVRASHRGTKAPDKDDDRRVFILVTDGQRRTILERICGSPLPPVDSHSTRIPIFKYLGISKLFRRPCDRLKWIPCHRDIVLRGHLENVYVSMNEWPKMSLLDNMPLSMNHRNSARSSPGSRLWAQVVALVHQGEFIHQRLFHDGLLMVLLNAVPR